MTPDKIAAQIIAADRVSDTAVLNIVNEIPHALMVDVVACLASRANSGIIAGRRATRHGHNANRAVPQVWSAAEVKAAHAAHYRGHRDAWTMAGERLYQRGRKAAQRARSADASTDGPQRSTVLHIPANTGESRTATPPSPHGNSAIRQARADDGTTDHQPERRPA